MITVNIRTNPLHTSYDNAKRSSDAQNMVKFAPNMPRAPASGGPLASVSIHKRGVRDWGRKQNQQQHQRTHNINYASAFEFSENSLPVCGNFSSSEHAKKYRHTNIKKNAYDRWLFYENARASSTLREHTGLCDADAVVVVVVSPMGLHATVVGGCASVVRARVWRVGEGEE